MKAFFVKLVSGIGIVCLFGLFYLLIIAITSRSNNQQPTATQPPPITEKPSATFAPINGLPGIVVQNVSANVSAREAAILALQGHADICFIMDIKAKDGSRWTGIAIPKSIPEILRFPLKQKAAEILGISGLLAAAVIESTDTHDLIFEYQGAGFVPEGN